MKTSILILALFCSGCVIDRYTSSTGAKFSRYAIGNKTQAAKVEIMTTNGIVLKIDGYKNDQTQSMEALAKGVTEGVIKAVTGK